MSNRKRHTHAPKVCVCPHYVSLGDFLWSFKITWRAGCACSHTHTHKTASSMQYTGGGGSPTEHTAMVLRNPHVNHLHHASCCHVTSQKGNTFTKPGNRISSSVLFLNGSAQLEHKILWQRQAICRKEPIVISFVVTRKPQEVQCSTLCLCKYQTVMAEIGLPHERALSLYPWICALSSIVPESYV